MKILVAEDKPAFRTMLAAMLKPLDFQPVLASDGNEAWEILAGECPPQLALLDWMMPGIDGVELCRKVRKHAGESYTHLILLTSKGRIGRYRHSHGSGSRRLSRQAA